MSDVTNSIRLNDYMSSTLQTINRTMEMTIDLMERMDRQLMTLGTGAGLHNMNGDLSAVMARLAALEGMIISIGSGAGPPNNTVIAQLNAQLIAAQNRIALLEAQLAGVGSGGVNHAAFNQLNAQLTTAMERIAQLETQLANMGSHGNGGSSAALGQLNAQLTAAQNRIAALEAQLAALGSRGNNSSANNMLTRIVLQGQQANSILLQMTTLLSQLNTNHGPNNTTAEINRLNQELQEANNRIQRLEEEINRLNSNSGRVGSSFNGWAMNLTGVFSALQMIQMVMHEIVGLLKKADEYTNANARLMLINDGLRTQAAMQQQILDLANASYSSYSATATLVARMGRTSYFKGDNDSAMRFADIVNKSLSISGAGVAESSSVLLQLSQAMSSGVLRGEEFNAVMENGSRLAEALATQLQVDIGTLRRMAMEGQLTADVVAGAIMQSGEMIDAEFNRMPVTFGQAMTVIDNEIGRWLGEMAKAEGALGKINQMFIAIGLWLQSESGRGFLDSVAYGLNAVVTLTEAAINILQLLGEQLNWLGPVAETVLIAAVAFGAIAAAQALAGMAAAMATAAASFVMAHPIMAAVAAAIGVLITIAKHFGITMTDVVMTVIGAWFWLLNTFEEVVFKIQTLFYNLDGAVSNILMNIISGVQRFINDFLAGVDALIDALNKFLPFSHMEHTTKFTFADDRRASMENYLTRQQQQLNQSQLALESRKQERQAKLEEYRVYWENKFGDKQTLSDELPSIGTAAQLKELASVDKVGKVGSIDDDVNIADEDLKMLMELAVQNRVNQINLTVNTVAPSITNHNSINNGMDIAQFVDSMTYGLNESRMVTVEEVY